MDDAVIEPGIAEREAHDPQPENLLEQLAAKRQEIADTKETFIPIPGYDKEPPLLLARYRLLEGPELAIIGDKIRREVKGRWDRTLFAAIDTFIAACIGIFVDTGDGKPVPLQLHGQPIAGFNDDLAEALQFKGDLRENFNHRDVVLGLFAKNDVAITSHAMALNRWFGDTTVDVSQDMLGGNS